MEFRSRFCGTPRKVAFFSAPGTPGTPGAPGALAGDRPGFHPQPELLNTLRPKGPVDAREGFEGAALEPGLPTAIVMRRFIVAGHARARRWILSFNVTLLSRDWVYATSPLICITSAIFKNCIFDLVIPSPGNPRQDSFQARYSLASCNKVQICVGIMQLDTYRTMASSLQP